MRFLIASECRVSYVRSALAAQFKAAAIGPPPDPDALVPPAHFHAPLAFATLRLHLLRRLGKGMDLKKLADHVRAHARPPQWSAKLRLRTKFLLSVSSIIAGLTFATLLIVGHAAEDQVLKSVEQDTRNSELTFQNLRAERQIQLNRSADVFATLPAVKELMADENLSSIQNASEEIWRSGDAELFALAD